MVVMNNNINNTNDMNGLEINNLLTSFNDFNPQQNEIRLIENDTKDKIKLKLSSYKENKDVLDVLAIEFNENLTNLEWYYIAFLKFPDFPEYSSTYYRIKNRLDSILNEMNLIGVDIQKNIDYLNEISIILNVELDIYRKENKYFEDKVKNVESVDTTSQGLMDDYTDLYKNQRSYNIGMVITFVIAFFIMRRIFSNKLENDTSSQPLSPRT
jgi:hypothetical protein